MNDDVGVADGQRGAGRVHSMRQARVISDSMVRIHHRLIAIGKLRKIARGARNAKLQAE